MSRCTFNGCKSGSPEGKDVIIIGAGLSGLSCARHLMESNVKFTLLDGQCRIGGRLKTGHIDGFILNHGFQVLQTAHPEARRLLDFKRHKLKRFAPGAIIRCGEYQNVPGIQWTLLSGCQAAEQVKKDFDLRGH